MNANTRDKTTFMLGSLAVLALVLLMWQIVIVVWKLPPYMLPPPKMVGATIVERLPDLWDAFLTSAEAAGGGLVASIVAGVLIALLFASSNWVRRLFFPYTILLQTVPIVAVAPLILMWAGQGLFAVGVITFIICLAPIIANTTQGLISVDENMVQLFQMHNASRWQILRQLRLPHALPSMFVGIRIASGIAVIGELTGELFAASSTVGRGGLGYSIQYANAQLQMAYLFALVIAATVLGFSFFFLAMFFEWLALHKWHTTPRQQP
jgi:NitT/TauT family transport system permease protein